MAAEASKSRRRDLLKSADFFAGHLKSAVERAERVRHSKVPSSDDFRAPYDASATTSRTRRRRSDSECHPPLKVANAPQVDLSTRNLLNVETPKIQRKNGLTRTPADTSIYKLDDATLHKLAESKTWPGRDLLAEPSDLICFLAGCSPGKLECRKEHATHNVSKKSPNQFDGSHDQFAIIPSSPASRDSTVSSDQFPHATQWVEASRKSSPVPLTTGIVTNFSLPGPKPSHTGSNMHAVHSVSDQLPLNASNSPLPSFERHEAANITLPADTDHVTDSVRTGNLRKLHSVPPSMISKGSRTSAIRHNLLKSSVSESPLDSGLPVPPILSPGVALPELSMPSSRREDGLDATQRQSASNQAENLPHSTCESTKDPMPKAQQVPTISLQPTESMQEISLSTTNSSLSEPFNSACRELVPKVKEAVHSVVHTTVRSMINEAIKSRDIDSVKASKAYRRAVAESLNEAAKEADDFLRRPSQWEDVEEAHAHDGFVRRPCHRITCLDDPSIQHCNTFSCTPDLSPLHPEPVLTWRGHDCNVCPRPSDQALAGTIPQPIQRRATLDVTTRLPPLRTPPINLQDKTLEDGLPDVEPIARKWLGLTISPRERPYRTLSLGSDISDRATESIESLSEKEAPSEDEPQQSLLPSHDSLSYLSIKDPAKRRNTVKWLRDLLKNNGGYETRLTALPPRNRRGQDSTALPAKTQEISAFPNATKSFSNLSRNNHDLNNQSKSVSIPEGLSQTINDIEDILRGTLHTSDRQLGSRNGHYEQLDDAASKSCGSSIHGSVGSVHESLRVCSLSTESSRKNSYVGVEEEAMKCRSVLHSGIDPRLALHTFYTDSGGRESRNFAKDDESIEFQNLEPFSKSRLSVPNRTTSTSPCQSPHRVLTRLSTAKSGDSREVVPLPRLTPRNTVQKCVRGHSAEDHDEVRKKLLVHSIPSKVEVLQHVMHYHQPPIQIRGSSMRLRHDPENRPGRVVSGPTSKPDNGPKNAQQVDNASYGGPSITRTSTLKSRQDQLRQMSFAYSHSLDGTQWTHSDEGDFNQGYGQREEKSTSAAKHANDSGAPDRELDNEIELRDVPNPNLPVNTGFSRSRNHLFNLKNKRHVSLADHRGFSLARSYKRQTIARDWSPGRKRFCAAIACISTALVGILVGIYAGETPAIQYWIVDFHHYTVLGNVFFFIGLSIPTFLFWPLPLLHGRKPYILGAMSLAMPLLFPQALAVGELRSPYTHVWRVALILPRALMGFCLGFANMNFKGILTDLFGASLQSTNPHQEHVDEFDVRRHGGGMGVWLGLWTWSAMGSIGVGFLIGAAIINNLNPAWGFYVSITIIAFVLLLNILTPEVRRSAFRRSVAEVKNGEDISRRLARGEVKMHMVQTGPKWWGEEFHYGLKLSIKMLRQPGFMVMAAYVAWMYGQIVLIVLLLGSLCSNSYRFKSHQVGLSVASVPLGALLAVPFQKASLFSRGRSHAPVSDDDTSKRKVKWSSHLVRRAIFVLALPFAGLGYTLSSGGTKIPFIIPILFAAIIGFLSNLAMAECHGIIMETFDTSDLQPGMTGRSRGNKSANKRTNYSSFPRVSAAFGITQGLGYLFAAAASGVGGALTRNLGQQAATGVMAFILLVLSVLLLGVLVRFKDVQIIPDCKKDEMDRYHQSKNNMNRVDSHGEDIEPWRPIIIGNPHHSTRRMCILELGNMSRFSEIRLKNRLIDEQSLEARHPNQQMMMDVKQKFKEKEEEVLHHVRTSLSRQSSRRSVFSTESKVKSAEHSGGDLGGFVEVDLGESSQGRRKGTSSRKMKGKGKEREMHSAKGSFQRRATGIEE